MDKISVELLQTLYLLLPGFVAAAIIFSLTPRKEKREQWEQILTALMLTGIIKAIVISLRWSLLRIGDWKAIGIWTDNCTLVSSYVIAVVFGCLAARMINRDSLHGIGRKLGFTKQTAAPSVWCYAFDNHEWYIVLHLKGGKRLYGWPDHWPDKSDCGHFSIKQPAWFSDDGSEMWQLLQLERMLIPAADVSMVEMYKKPDALKQLALDEEQIKEIQRPLAELHRKELANGG